MRVEVDPDTKWVVYIDWSDWLAELASVTGSTVTITSSSWSVPAAITEEAETPTDDASGICYFVGTGGVAGTSYDLVNTITYTPAAISGLTDATAQRTLTVYAINQ